MRPRIPAPTLLALATCAAATLSGCAADAETTLQLKSINEVELIDLTPSESRGVRTIFLWLLDEAENSIPDPYVRIPIDGSSNDCQIELRELIGTLRQRIATVSIHWAPNLGANLGVSDDGAQQAFLIENRLTLVNLAADILYGATALLHEGQHLWEASGDCPVSFDFSTREANAFAAEKAFLDHTFLGPMTPIGSKWYRNRKNIFAKWEEEQNDPQRAMELWSSAHGYNHRLEDTLNNWASEWPAKQYTADNVTDAERDDFLGDELLYIAALYETAREHLKLLLANTEEDLSTADLDTLRLYHYQYSSVQLMEQFLEAVGDIRAYLKRGNRSSRSVASKENALMESVQGFLNDFEQAKPTLLKQTAAIKAVYATPIGTVDYDRFTAWFLERPLVGRSLLPSDALQLLH